MRRLQKRRPGFSRVSQPMNCRTRDSDPDERRLPSKLPPLCGSPATDWSYRVTRQVFLSPAATKCTSFLVYGSMTLESSQPLEPYRPSCHPLLVPLGSEASHHSLLTFLSWQSGNIICLAGCCFDRVDIKHAGGQLPMSLLLLPYIPPAPSNPAF